jgi:hypothetical protein
MVSIMRTRLRHMGYSAVALKPLPSLRRSRFHRASSQAGDAQAQTESFSFAPQRLTLDATTGKTLRPSARKERGGSHCIARMVKSFIFKVDQIVFVMRRRILAQPSALAQRCSCSPATSTCAKASKK